MPDKRPRRKFRGSISRLARCLSDSRHGQLSLYSLPIGPVEAMGDFEPPELPNPFKVNPRGPISYTGLTETLL
jgi:hypothetical protein